MVPFSPLLGVAVLAFASLRLAAADDLPKRAPGEVPDGEPRLMLDDLPDIPLPAPSAPGDTAGPATGAGIERARLELERARSKQQRWQKLAKAGVLSQVEAESTALLVAQALVKYQTALAAQATAEAAQSRARRERGESSAEELAAAEAAQQTTAALAANAAAHLQRQQRLAAEAHLDRQRRLFAVGVASRAQLQRAQAAVEKLRPNSELK